jgi:branched-chain amino acid transport system ATP-binding protein
MLIWGKPHVLELNRVCSSYGRIQVLHDVSLKVPAGKIVCLLGANGAGKTTTVRTIVGLHRSARSDIKFLGQPIGTVAAHKIVTLGIAMVPERRELFPDMSVADNLEMGAYSLRDRTQIRTDLRKIYELFPVLAERKSSYAGMLSGGQQQMVAIGRALMSRPKLLLLDEPTLGLAPLLVRQIFESLKSLHAEGLTILLIDQNARQALALADYGYVLENGRIVIEGEASSLQSNAEVERAYLGAI